jgi:hypothetical protein
MSKQTDFQKLEQKATFTKHHLLALGVALSKLTEALPNTKFYKHRFGTIRKNYEEMFRALKDDFALQVRDELISNISVEGI